MLGVGIGFQIIANQKTDGRQHRVEFAVSSLDNGSGPSFGGVRSDTQALDGSDSMISISSSVTKGSLFSAMDSGFTVSKPDVASVFSVVVSFFVSVSLR